MVAFYNEHDPFAAAWTRNLIAAGLIAPGIVNERDIRDICPDDLRDFDQCHFFAGIGGWSLAARLAGWPDNRPLWTGSCPCQPFSAAGKGGGFDDERHLWPAFFHLICERGPEVVFGEQVASKDGLEWLDLVQSDLEGTDHAFWASDLCAAGIGAPHAARRRNHESVFGVSPVMNAAHGDFESASVCNLRLLGVHMYVADRTTKPWCFSWAIGDEPVELWTPEKPGNIARLFAHIAAGGIFMAWNCAFEFNVWNTIMVPQFGWPELPIEQCRCVQAAALAMGLPGKLEHCAPTVGIEDGKDMEGAALMMQLARPRQVLEDGTIIWWDTPEKLKRLGEYCIVDTALERRIERLIPPLSEQEQAVWILDQKINNRGLQIDIAAIDRALSVVESAKANLDKRMNALTNGAVPKCTTVESLKDWVREQGVDVEGLAKADILELLDLEIPDPVRRALLLRQEAAMTSTSKLKTMRKSAGADGRMRGCFQYHGATTGRFAGRRLGQNLPRTSMKQYEINGVLDLLSQPCPPDMDETIEILYGSPLKVISETIRGYIVAPPGKVLRVGDFSSIEARGIAWLAGAEHILDVFRTGADIYCKAAEDIYSKPINKKDHPYERGVGKVVVLACGYQGSVGAFQKMARGYDVVVTDETALSVVKAWRSKNPEIVGYWKNVESAAVAAVVDRAKGTVHKVGPPGREVRFGVRGAFLRCRLPSGRFLSYPYPRLVDYVWIRKGAVGMVEANGDEPAILEVGAQSRKVPVAELSRWIARGWTQNGNPSPAIHYKYYEKQKWVEGSTYGGSIVENITQGLCRDILCEAMLRLDLECYDLTMHFHDEPVAETLEDFGSTEELVRIMEIPPYWAGGFPIEVGKDAYASRRYRK